MDLSPSLATFLGASLVLAVTPGPGVTYIVARSVTQGRRFGLASVAGVAAGNLCNAIGASVGLAAVFAVSGVAFAVIKWAGAAYLVYLGINAIRKPSPDRAETLREVPAAKILHDGFIVALLNPKTAIFFASFLPQFMPPDLNPAVQGVVLGSVFVGIAAITDSGYALTAGSVAGLVSSSLSLQRCGRFLSGSVLIALGAYAAIGGNKVSR